MRFLIVYVLLGVVQALTDSERKIIESYNQECAKFSHVDPRLIEDAKGGIFSDDLKLKSHGFCFSKKLGFQDDAGNVKIERIRARLGEKLPESQVRTAISKCVIVQRTPEETAFHFLKCLHETVPKGTVYVA